MKENFRALLPLFVGSIIFLTYYLFVFEYPKYVRKLIEQKYDVETLGVLLYLKENIWISQSTQGNKLKTKNWFVRYNYKIKENTYLDSVLIDANALSYKEQTILRTLKIGSFVKIKYNPANIQENFFCIENEYINK